MRIGGWRRATTIQDVAREMQLDWAAVMDLDEICIREPLLHAGHPAPRAIGIDEIPIRKPHAYRIVAGDLERKRAIWFGGEADTDRFHPLKGPENAPKVRLAVMDGWLPFGKSTQAHAPNAAVSFDEVHILRHLGEALDKARKTKSARLAGKQCKFIKGHKYVRPSPNANLTSQGKLGGFA
jgi:transposase